MIKGILARPPVLDGMDYPRASACGLGPRGTARAYPSIVTIIERVAGVVRCRTLAGDEFFATDAMLDPLQP